MSEVRLKDLKAGDTIELDDGFDCINAGAVRVEVEPGSDGLDDDPYFRCKRGKHFLCANQVESGGALVGVLGHSPAQRGK